MNDIPLPYTVESILNYKPMYGDYLIWSRWFSAWHGYLIDMQDKELHFIMAGVPILLLSDNQSAKSIIKININDIRNSKGGKYSIVRPSNNEMKWYV